MTDPATTSSVLAVVLVLQAHRQNTLYARARLFLHSPRGTCTSPGAIEVAFPRAADLEVVSCAPPPRRGSIASTRRSGPRGGAVVPRLDIPARGATSTAFTGAPRREGLRTRWERATRREDAVRAFRRRPAAGRPGNVAESRRERRRRGLEPAVDVRGRRGGRVDATRQVIARAGGAGGRPVGAGAWSSRAVLPLVGRQAREHATAAAGVGRSSLEGGGTDEDPPGALTSRGWGSRARVDSVESDAAANARRCF